MATWKSTSDQRAQAAQLVLKRVEEGETMADSVRHFASALEVSEDTLRRWVRQEKAGAQAAAATPEPARARVSTAVLERPSDAPFAAAVGTHGLPPLEQAPASPRWRKYRRAIAVVAALGSAFVGWAVVEGISGGFSDEKAAERVADYVAGKGTNEFVATDSNFRVSFPFGKPERSTETEKIGADTVEFVTYGTETEKGAFLVSSFLLPAGVPYDLNAGVNGAAVAADGHIESATPITFAGFPAMEFVMTGVLEGKNFVDKGLVVDAGSRVYMLQALWQDGPSPGYDAFKASFRIGA